MSTSPSVSRLGSPSDRILPVLGFLFVLLGSSLWFLQLVTPLRLTMSARSSVPQVVQLHYASGDPYIPAFQYTFPKERLKPASTFSALSFELDNEETDDIRFAFQQVSGAVEIESVGVQGLLLHTVWDGARLADSFTVSHGTLSQTGSALVVDTASETTLVASPQFVAEIGMLAARQNAIVLFLALLGVGLFTFPIWSVIFSRRTVTTKANVREGRRFWKEPVTLATLLLLLLGSVRLLSLVLHDPMIGVPNNGDFYRLEACLGWQSTAPTDAAGVEIVSRASPLYRTGLTPVKEVCYLSSQLLFLLPATFAGQWSGGLVDLRVLGLLMGLVWVVAGVGLTWLLHRAAPIAGLISAAVFSLLIADPMYGVYLNTLLSEPGTLLFGYLTVGLMAYSILTGRLSFSLLLGIGLVLFYLALAKLQTMYLPLGLVVLFIFILWRVGAFASRRALWLSLALLVVVSLWGYEVQRYQQDRPGFMRANHYVNQFNTLFGTLLPTMNAPLQGAAALQFPESCFKYVGLDWYDTSRDTLPCREEVLQVSLYQELGLFFMEPSLLTNLTVTAIPLTRPWLYHAEVGIPAEMYSGTNAAWWSLALLVDSMPITSYRLAFFVSALGALLAVFVLVAPLRFPPILLRVAGIQLVLAAIVVYSLAAAILGDGYFDLARHTFLLRAPLVTSLVVCATMVWLVFGFFMSRQGRTSIYAKI